MTIRYIAWNYAGKLGNRGRFSKKEIAKETGFSYYSYLLYTEDMDLCYIGTGAFGRENDGHFGEYRSTSEELNF